MCFSFVPNELHNTEYNLFCVIKGVANFLNWRPDYKKGCCQITTNSGRVDGPSLEAVKYYTALETTSKVSVSLVLLFIGMCLSKMHIFVLFYKLLTTFLPNFK